MLGIYEASIRKITFDTGLTRDEVSKTLSSFKKLGKVKYVNNYVVLVNFLKHQNFNTNMKKSAIDVYNNLPNDLKDSELNISKDNALEGFETLLNHYGMVSKIEVEDETEDETEEKPKKVFIPPTKKEFMVFAKSKYKTEDEYKCVRDKLLLKYDSWSEADWVNGRTEKKIKNWKVTLLNTIPHL